MGFRKVQTNRGKAPAEVSAPGSKKKKKKAKKKVSGS